MMLSELDNFCQGSLRESRQADEYVIPRGDWFEIVSSPHYLSEIVTLFSLKCIDFYTAYTATIHLAKPVFDAIEGYIRQFCGCYWWIKSDNMATFCFCGNISSPGLAWFSCFELIITI